MMRAVSLAARASTPANLAHSLDKFHKLDCPAFGIEAEPVDEAQCAEAARLLELQARSQAITPLQKARTLAAYTESAHTRAASSNRSAAAAIVTIPAIPYCSPVNRPAEAFLDPGSGESDAGRLPSSTDAMI
jgi:hypothetical protein